MNDRNAYRDTYFKLTADIVLNDTADWEEWGTLDDNDQIIAPANGWLAIGANDMQFAGYFDGDGHTVSGIYINTDADYQGLFGYTTFGTIKNIGVIDSYIKGNMQVGGVVGVLNDNTVTNCYNTGTVSGNGNIGGVVGSESLSTVSICYNTGTVSSTNANTGGLVGQVYNGIVTNCYNTGTVSSTNDQIGGLVGNNKQGTVTNCYNTGTICGNRGIGGVVGLSVYGAVSNCYNIGAVNGNDEFKGGVMGATYQASATDCYYLNTCITDYNMYGTVLTGTEMQTQEVYDGFDLSSVWELGYKAGYPYPTLRSFGSQAYKYWSNPFTDVKLNEWFCESVLYAYKQSLFFGTSAGKFSPLATMTRSMLVTVLYRIENEPQVTGSSIFTDVPQNQWYTDAVIWANQSGYVKGTSDTTFAPDASITRQDMVSILYRYALGKGYDTSIGGSLDAFKDANEVSDYARNAVLWAVGNGMVKGSNQRVMPKNGASRAEVAAILMRFCETFIK